MSQRVWVLRAGLGALGLAAIVAVAWEAWQQAEPSALVAPAHTANEAGARWAGEAVDEAPAGVGPADAGAARSAASGLAAPHDTPAAREGAASAALASVARLGDAAAPAPQGRAIPAEQLARHPQDTAANGAGPTVRVGQRIRVTGRLGEQVVGEPGVTVVVLATDAGPGLPLVWSPTHVAALDGLQAGAAMVADCLVQGEVLGRWILADCRP